MLHTVVYSSKSYYTNSGFSDVNRVHSRIPIITSVVVIYADQTAIPRVFAATFFASANFADILIGLPHLITSNCAVLAVLVLTADLHEQPNCSQLAQQLPDSARASALAV